MDSIEMDAAATLRGLRGETDCITDKQRLDWLEAQLAAATRGCFFRFGQDKTNGLWSIEGSNVRSSGWHKDMRAALDAAMEAHPNV